ncbi:MAG: hypothetical protein E6R04_04865 [Spirochaetes bacterium]|nr:MAG: hypothetical protein E6R04_04865 [Spirochaetota bacterium]
MTRIHLDFEYNHTNRARMNLVCCHLIEDGKQGIDYWLDGDEKARFALKELLKEYRDAGDSLVCFSATAEASALIALGLDPTKFKWIDLQAEWKMLINHNSRWAYGDQIIDGKKKTTKPPKSKWDMTEEEKRDSDHSKPDTNLVACAYKLLGVEIDSDHKTKMRDLIISCPASWAPEDRQAVLDYCRSDTEILPKLLDRFLDLYREDPARHSGAYTAEAVHWRGETGARAALIEKTGYPVNREKVTNFAATVPDILNDIREDINRQFPEIKVFVKNKDGSYTAKQKPQMDFIDASPYASRWMQTDGKKHSLALEAWTRHYNYQHDYPEGNFPAQMIRFLKTKQNLNGFIPSSGKKTFFDTYSDDGRARCYLNPYGSQSSRFQPPSTGFIPLKSAWMRSLIEPLPGFAITSIDYASQEFLICALLSKDQKMYESYVSGDPYLAFAKLAGAVPKEGTKDSHPLERSRFKSTVLGIGYLMGPISLAAKLTADTGIPHTEDDARKLTELYFSVYDRYSYWVEETIGEYRRRGFLTLPDGWVMHGDNPNHRSIANCPVQGTGAAIMRRAIHLSQKRGLKIIFPLHDAKYMEHPVGELWRVDVLANSMVEAFGHYFKDPVVHGWSQAIRLDYDIWGPDLTDGYVTTPAGRKVKSQKIYIDPRGKNEYERFKKFFKKPDTEKEQNHA